MPTPDLQTAANVGVFEAARAVLRTGLIPPTTPAVSVLCLARFAALRALAQFPPDLPVQAAVCLLESTSLGPLVPGLDSSLRPERTSS